MSVTAIVITCLVVLSPLLWFLGGFIFKILWGYGPLIASVAGSAYLLWIYGMDWIISVPVGMMLGIALTWLWQRTRIFLSVDRWVETHVFFDR